MPEGHKTIPEKNCFPSMVYAWMLYCYYPLRVSVYNTIPYLVDGLR